MRLVENYHDQFNDMHTSITGALQSLLLLVVVYGSTVASTALAADMIWIHGSTMPQWRNKALATLKPLKRAWAPVTAHLIAAATFRPYFLAALQAITAMSKQTLSAHHSARMGGIMTRFARRITMQRNRLPTARKDRMQRLTARDICQLIGTITCQIAC